jgi:Ca2+-dependent lipid-binding protein
MPTLRLNLIRGEDLMPADSNGFSDPFCYLMLNEKGFKKIKSKVIKKTLTPHWNQTFYIDVADPTTAVINVEVMDFDLLKSNDPIGNTQISLAGLAKGIEVERELKLESVPHGRIFVGLNALDFDTMSHGAKSEPKVGTLRVTIVAARNLIPMDRTGTSDPFVTLKLQDKTRLKRTSVVKKNLDPAWNETFDFDITAPNTDLLRFYVYDYDKYSTNDFLG